MLNSLRLATELADDVAARDATRPVGPWMWGPALQGFAFGQAETYLGEPRYRDWLTRFADHYVAHPPRVESSDTVAPGLVTSYLADVTPPSPQQAAYQALTERCVSYIRSAPRLVGDTVNHLGTSRWNWLYPRSVWVDSIMMFSVFPARYGASHDLPDLVALAARQPAQYADLLYDRDRALWAHSWWARLPGRAAGPFPREVFWARGNAWIVAALPMIVEAIGRDHPAVPGITTLLRETSAALRRRQLPNGAWPTVLEPSEPRTYRELSATALIAAGWFDACRLGLLDASYVSRAREALAACTASFRHTKHGWAFPENSGPTIPLPLFPRQGYARIPRHENEPYGVAALLLAAIAADKAIG